MLDRRSLIAGGSAIVAAISQQRALASQMSGVASPAALGGAATAFLEVSPQTGILRAQIAPDAGGELAGLQCWIAGEPVELLFRGRNYQPHAGFRGKALVLWPAVGRNAVALPAGEVGDPAAAGWIWKGRRYSMPIHGFAGARKWTVEEVFRGETTAHAVVSIVDTPDTQAVYPFGFKFSINYRVAGTSVILAHKVSAAKSNSDAMPFSIGNHMGFNLPLVPSSNAELARFSSSAKRKVVLGLGNLPTGEVVDFDLSRPRPISTLGVQVPHPATGCPPGQTWTKFTDPGGMAITISHHSDWLPRGEPVMFNLYANVPRGFFSPEPWVGKQNSLASGDGLILLPPGEDFHWQIAIDLSFFGPLAELGQTTSRGSP